MSSTPITDKKKKTSIDLTVKKQPKNNNDK